MKLSKNIILTLILIVLASAAWAYQGPFQDWQRQRRLPQNFLKLKGEITKFEIDNGKTKIALAREGEQWRVSGQEGKFYANANEMEPLLETLNGLGKTELEVASKNSAKQADFKVAGEAALKVTLKSGKGEVKFNVGKGTQDFRGSYIGRDGDENTYRLNSANLEQLLNRPEWRDLSLFDLAAKQPTSLRLQYPDREVKLALRDGEWQAEAGKRKYEKEQMDKLAGTLVGLTAVEIPKQDFRPTGLDKPAMIIQFKGEGFDQTLMLGRKGPNNAYYAKRADSDNIYLISESDFETLTQKEKKASTAPAKK